MNSVQTNSRPVRGNTIASNSFLTLGTGALIVGLNIVFVPLMLRAFGTELYGVLSVTWLVLANLSWLDLGFSRASARYVSRELALGQLDEAALWSWTAVGSQVALGLTGAIILWFCAPWLVGKIHVQSANRELVIMTLKVFAFSIPFDFANRSFIGVLQAGQRFDWVNGLSVFNALSTFAVYALGILRGADFRYVVYGLCVLRFANLTAAYVGALRVLPSLNSFSHIRQLGRQYWSHALIMVRFGSWIAAASVLGCLLLYFDQWILSFLLGIGLLPFYTIPMNLLNRLSIFPSSLTQTLFPAFSALNAKSEWTRIDDYFVRSHRYLLTIMIPVCFILFVWGPEIFRLWLGTSFATHASLALKILSVGMLIGLLAPLSGSLLEAVGRPDVLVKLYLLELPFNVILVWFLTKHFGITGAAFSFVVRTILETILLWIAVYRISPASGMRFVNAGLCRAGAWSGAFGLLAYFMPTATIHNFANIVVTSMALMVYCLSARFYIFDAKDRAFAADFCRAKTNRLLRLKSAELVSIGFSKTAEFVSERESEASGD